MKRFSLIVAVLITSLLLFSSCNNISNEFNQNLSPELKTLEEMELLWQQHEANLFEYSFRLQVGTGFRPPRTADVIVTVKDGVFSGYEVAGDPSSPNPDHITPYYTFDRLFELLRQSYAVSGDTVDVEYNPDYGYPIRLVSYSTLQTLDIHFAAYISEFKPLAAHKITTVPATTLAGIDMEPNFSFIFRYGYGFEPKNEIDTLKDTYTKDMISAPPITLKLSLTQEEMDSIYVKMQEINFFDYPTDFSIQPSGSTTIVSTPSEKYYFKVIGGSRTKELSWDDKIKNPDIQATRLRELIQLIKSIISSKDEYKALPPATGAYG